MQKKLLKFLTCPYHTQADLRLSIIDTYITDDEINNGVLECPECGRWFVLIEGIPMLIRDELRLVQDEKNFLKKYKDKIPPEILTEGRPLNINTTSETLASSEADKKLLGEGKFWGDFFQTYYKSGDHSILDIRCRGTHRPFLPYGINECDNRDSRREYGLYPHHLGRKIFPQMKKLKNQTGIDAGCGGGQFGLEAAYCGAEMIGFDISYGALRVGLDYARSKNLLNMNYLYASPDMPPFKKGSFDFILFKDSIHHFPDPDDILKKLSDTLKNNAVIIAYEHVSEPRKLLKIKQKVSDMLIKIILKKYKPGLPDPIFANIPPNEDAGMDKVVSAVNKYFNIDSEFGETRLYLDLDALFYFAAGKRQTLSDLIMNLILLIEKCFSPFIKPRHLLMIGKKKS